MKSARLRFATAVLIALGTLTSAAGCPPKKGDQETKCNDTCTEQDDTVTSLCIWLPATDLPDTLDKLLGEVTYTEAGVIKYSGTGDVTKGKVYTNWYHDWKKNKYPRISITCDEKWHAGVYCQTKLKTADAPTSIVIDHQGRGPKSDPGNVTCSTDQWVDQHFNKGE